MKLAPKDTVKRYELTYLLPVSFTDTELRELKEGIDKMLAKHKATVESSEDWGKKKLAYKISYKSQAQTEAAYTYVEFAAPSASISKIDNDLKLHEQIMRYLIVVAPTQKK